MPLHGAFTAIAVANRMKVMVTGAAGFIGSHVVDALVDAGCEVLAVDALLPTAHERRPSYLNERAENIRVDLRQADETKRLVGSVDAVSHQAAMVGLGASFTDVTDYVSHNDVGTAVLLRALYERRFTGRIVLASSMVVYGEGGYQCRIHGSVRPGARESTALEAGVFNPTCHCGRELEPIPIDEDTPVDPRNVYAATKLHQEHLCFAFGRETKAPVTALRYHNVYGARMPVESPYAGVASLFRSALQRNRSPQVYEDGRQLRDFVHVSDVARANVAALEHAGRGGAYNIASGRPSSIGAMATALSAAFGAGAPPPQTTGRYRLGDVRHVFASPDRARKVLGFSASIGLHEGMHRFAAEPLR